MENNLVGATAFKPEKSIKTYSFFHAMFLINTRINIKTVNVNFQLFKFRQGSYIKIQLLKLTLFKHVFNVKHLAMLVQLLIKNRSKIINY